MAIGDNLRLARAQTAATTLQNIKSQEALADRLARIGVSRRREVGLAEREEARIAEREEFQGFRGEFGVAEEAGTTTPEMRRRALELGITRPDVPEEPRELRESQILADELAALERKNLAGTLTVDEDRRLTEFRADKRAPVTAKPTPISITLGKQGFQQLKDLTEFPKSDEIITLSPEDITRIQSIPNRVGSLIAQFGYDNFDVGFGDLKGALDQILPDTRTITSLSKSFLGFGGGDQITETDPLDIAEKFDMLLTAKDIVTEVLRSGQSEAQQKATLKSHEIELAKQIGTESAANLIDFLLRALR